MRNYDGHRALRLLPFFPFTYNGIHCIPCCRINGNFFKSSFNRIHWAQSDDFITVKNTNFLSSLRTAKPAAKILTGLRNSYRSHNSLKVGCISYLSINKT